MGYLLLFCLVTLTFATQYVPIPRRQPGLTIGNPTANLHIQAFYDLLCSDSKTADQTLQNVLATLGPTMFSLSYVFVPLPYHIYSFKVHQLYFYILDTFGNKAALTYVAYMLENQDDFMESDWRNKRISDFQFSLANATSSVLGVNGVELLKALKAGSASDIRARSEWKFAVGTLSVSGTPIFYANGVRIDGAEDWDQTQWTNFIIEHS